MQQLGFSISFVISINLDFENSPLPPRVFRQKTKKLILCPHVDDLVLCAERGN